MDVIKKYVTFSGRARRKEYWMFILFNFIIVIVLSIVDGIAGTTSESGQGLLSGIYQLAVVIPTIAVGIRRMHDADHSGWWLLVPIVNLVFAVSEGTRGQNSYGPDPKAVAM